MELITVDRKIAPPIIDAVNFHLELKPYEKFTLDNGVPVYAVNAGAEEVMMAELVFFSGNSFEEKNLIAAAANFLLKNGTLKKKAFQLLELNRLLLSDTRNTNHYSRSQKLSRRNQNHHLLHKKALYCCNQN